MSETRFFVEPPQDDYGNTGHPLAVIEAAVEEWNDGNQDRETLHVIAPASLAADWPVHYRDVAGWLETEGPARYLTREEWAKVVEGGRKQ